MSDWFRVYGFADIQDKLLVGAYPLDQSDVSMLEWMKVDRILNLVEDKEYEPGQREEIESALDAAGIEERRMSFTDYGRLPAAELEQAVGQVIEWIEEGRRVYLHCRAGWQRSAAVAAGLVAITEGVEIDDALDRVRQRKPSADPLPEQRGDLITWWGERNPRRLGAPTGRGAPELADDGHYEPSELSDEALDLLRWWARRDPDLRADEADDAGDVGR